MSYTMNKVQLIGRLGKKPELNHTKGDVPVINFYIATDEITNQIDETTGKRIRTTEWHRVVAWKRNAEFVAKYLNTGNVVYVEGKLKTREWTDKSGVVRKIVEIVAEQIQTLTKINFQNVTESSEKEVSDEPSEATA